MAEYLIHYGIDGQKWGVRKYQNEDGTYTQAGLQRYNDDWDRYNAMRSKAKNIKARYKASVNKERKKALKEEYKQYKKESNELRNRATKEKRHLKEAEKLDAAKKLIDNGESLEKLNKYSKVRSKSFIASKALSNMALTAAVAYLMTKNVNFSKVSAELTLGKAAVKTANKTAKYSIKKKKKLLKTYENYQKNHPEET